MESRIDSSSDDKTCSVKERLDRLANDIKKLPPDRIEELEKIIHTMGRKVVTIKEAAELLGLHVDTIRRALNSGSLKGFQLNGKGSWRIPMEEIERFLAPKMRDNQKNY